MFNPIKFKLVKFKAPENFNCYLTYCLSVF